MTPDQFNRWRVFPRVAFGFFLIVVWDNAQWFQALPSPTEGQSVYASAVLAAACAWFKFYVESGNATTNPD